MTKPIPWVKHEKLDKNGGRFIISPLKRGMGITIGNSLRRTLLSSLSGLAITAINIDGVDHEFSVLQHIKEDMLDIICNLKSVVFKGDDVNTKTLKIHVNKKGKIFAGNIECDSEIMVVNKDLFIAEMTEDRDLLIEITVERGVGYCSSEANKNSSQSINTINLDSSFSPISRVNHKVDNIRVGKELDYETLTLEVWTNGSIQSEDAVKEASEILMYHINLFKDLNKRPENEVIDAKSSEEIMKKENALLLSIDDLELSARSSNCLKRAGIDTVGQLIEKDLSELIKIKNFGKKSADEINEKLKQYGLCLKILTSIMEGE